MKGLTFRHRVGFAVKGIALAWMRERSFRVQVAMAVAALAALLATRPAALWWALFGLTTGCVLATELFNAAIEALCDHLHPDRHPAIKAVKDMAAAAVLVSALGALGVAVAFAVSMLD